MYRKDDNVPCSCPDIQAKIEKLKWVNAARKIIPNLPKGKLKDIINQEIESVINNQDSPLQRDLAILSDLFSFTGPIKQLVGKLDVLKDQKRPSQQSIDDISLEIGKIRDTLSSLSGRR